MMNGLALPLRDQVVHDQVRLALRGPAGLVLAAAVLKVQHRVPRLRGLVVVGRRVDEAATRGVVDLGVVDHLANLSVRDVLERVEVLVLGGHLHAAAPAAGAVEIQAAGIRHLRVLDPELIVMEALVLGRRLADPRAILSLRQRVPHRTDVEHDALGLRRGDADADAAFGVHLRVLATRLVGGRRLEVFHGRPKRSRSGVCRGLRRLRQDRRRGQRDREHQRTHAGIQTSLHIGLLCPT